MCVQLHIYTYIYTYIYICMYIDTLIQKNVLLKQRLIYTVCLSIYVDVNSMPISCSQNYIPSTVTSISSMKLILTPSTPCYSNLLPQHPRNPCGSCGITTTSTTFTTFGGICHITAIDVSPPASALRQVSQPTHGRELDFCFCCATPPGSRTHRNLAPQPPGCGRIEI